MIFCLHRFFFLLMLLLLQHEFRNSELFLMLYEFSVPTFDYRGCVLKSMCWEYIVRFSKPMTWGEHGFSIYAFEVTRPLHMLALLRK